LHEAVLGQHLLAGDIVVHGRLERMQPVSRCHAGRRSSRTVGPGTPRPSACTLQHITVSPSKIGDIVRAHPHPHHFEHGYIP
jgi:hypothetical protein